MPNPAIMPAIAGPQPGLQVRPAVRASGPGGILVTVVGLRDSESESVRTSQ
jgi:hypothetical protein